MGWDMDTPQSLEINKKTLENKTYICQTAHKSETGIVHNTESETLDNIHPEAWSYTLGVGPGGPWCQRPPGLWPLKMLIELSCA